MHGIPVVFLLSELLEKDDVQVATLHVGVLTFFFTVYWLIFCFQFRYYWKTVRSCMHAKFVLFLIVVAIIFTVQTSFFYVGVGGYIIISFTLHHWNREEINISIYIYI